MCSKVGQPGLRPHTSPQPVHEVKESCQCRQVPTGGWFLRHCSSSQCSTTASEIQKLGQGNKHKKKKHKKGWSCCTFCSTQQAFVKNRRKHSAEEARRQETSPGSEASLRNRAGSGKSRGDIYPALWLPTAQLFSRSALQDSMSGFHRHCTEDGPLSSKGVILLFTSTVCRPQGKKLAFSLLC